MGSFVPVTGALSILGIMTYIYYHDFNLITFLFLSK